jgi:hypothetical protein
MAILRLMSLHWLIFQDRWGEYLAHSKLLHFFSLQLYLFPKIVLPYLLLEDVTIFTDASWCGTAAYYTKDCHKVEHTVFASAQRVEMYAVVMVLRDFPQQPINLCSDSYYVVGDLHHYIGQIVKLFNFFFQLCSVVQILLYPCFVIHLCSRSNLCG